MGPESISKFKGMFAFAVWDRQEKELFIFRDRLGVETTYYYSDEGVFCFASELRAVMASGLVKKLTSTEKQQLIFSPFSLWISRQSCFSSKTT
jgi:asparagine synthetase B (glutamine-hydrolysing)